MFNLKCVLWKKSTLIERACSSCLEFNNIYRKMKRSIELSGKSTSTLINYARCLATMTLYFNCSPLDLDSEQVLDYLHYLQSKKKTPSSSYFKHTLYGLRFVYKLYNKEPLLHSLPSLKKVHKLPVVLSVPEIKRLIENLNFQSIECWLLWCMVVDLEDQSFSILKYRILI